MSYGGGKRKRPAGSRSGSGNMPIGDFEQHPVRLSAGIYCRGFKMQSGTSIAYWGGQTSPRVEPRFHRIIMIRQQAPSLSSLYIPPPPVEVRLEHATGETINFLSIDRTLF